VPHDNFPGLRAPLWIAAFGLLALGGCVDPIARQDFIDPSLGDAVAANKAIHTADPWPRDSFDTRLPSDGQRAAGGLQRYRASPADAVKLAPGTQ